MAISTIGTDALASAAVTSAKLASGAPSRSQLPAGTVLQVVNATYSTYTTTTSSTRTATGLTASITPTSATSKILVLVDQAGCGKDSSSTSLGVVIVRNSTELINIATYAADTGTNTNNSIGSVSGCYLDSPATTSAVTYSTKFWSAGNAATAYVQYASAVSTITLMEIAA